VNTPVPTSVIAAPDGTSAYQLTYMPVNPHAAPTTGDQPSIDRIELTSRRTVAAGITSIAVISKAPITRAETTTVVAIAITSSASSRPTSIPLIAATSRSKVANVSSRP